jgi:hypothetical protein
MEAQPVNVRYSITLKSEKLAYMKNVNGVQTRGRN